MADEPTGNLDSRNADLVSGLLADLVKAGKTVVVVTHERRLDSSYDRIVTLVDRMEVFGDDRPVARGPRPTGNAGGRSRRGGRGGWAGSGR